MDQPLTLYGFQTSNNAKARIALGYREVPYTWREIEPADRELILCLSGQRLTPVLVHGDRVLFDSAAILRYVDANFPGPKLYGDDREQQWAIEDWERFGRTELADPMMAAVKARIRGKPLEAAEKTLWEGRFQAAAARLIEGLGGRAWLVGDRMSAADITTATVLHRILSLGLYSVPGDLSAARAWIARVHAHDQHAAGT